MKRLSGDYNRGYTRAIQDIQEIFEYIESDLKLYHKRMNSKYAGMLLKTILENREKIRDGWDGFIRFNGKLNNFEYFMKVKKMKTDRIYAGIMGLIVGDALGVPFEFKQRGTFRCEGMTGYGTYNMPPGTWSDDSSMTLATIDAIAKDKGSIDPHNILDAFAHWVFMGEYTPYGRVFDVGTTTRAALDRYNSGRPWNECGGRDIYSNGNGSLMRILPLAFTECRDQQIIDVSALTHANPISLDACIIYITIAKVLLQGVDLDKAIILAAGYTDLPEFYRLMVLRNLDMEEVESSGYVVHTLEAALWSLLHTDNYRDAVLVAVNLGDDTDTVAAVTGGLAGILYGVGGKEGIPEEWIWKLARVDYIEKLISNFADAVQGGSRSVQGKNT